MSLAFATRTAGWKVIKLKAVGPPVGETTCGLLYTFADSPGTGRHWPLAGLEQKRYARALTIVYPGIPDVAR